MTSSVTVAQFRQDFPAFADSNVVGDPTVQFWLNFADLCHDTDRWGTWITTAIELFVAHHSALDAEAEGDAKRGLPPGFTKGLINNESVDKASAGYDTSSVADPNAGHWNMTIYGLRWYRMARMIGAGPVTIVDPYAAQGSVSAYGDGGYFGPYFG